MPASTQRRARPSAEIGRVQLSHHRLKFATQRLHARSPVCPNERPELRSAQVLCRLDRWLSEQCHEQQAEGHRPHAEDDRTGKREALACRCYEPERLDRPGSTERVPCSGPSRAREGRLGDRSLRLEGAALADVWLDESAGRDAEDDLGLVSLHVPACSRVVAIRVVVGRAVEELRHNRGGPVVDGRDRRTCDCDRLTPVRSFTSADQSAARSSGHSWTR